MSKVIEFLNGRLETVDQTLDNNIPTPVSIAFWNDDQPYDLWLSKNDAVKLMEKLRQLHIFA